MAGGRRLPIWLLVIVAVGSMAMTLGTLFIISAFKAPRENQVAFGDFLAELDQGRVEEVRVKGRIYTFRSNANSRPRVTVGPHVSAEELRSLRPLKPELPAPHVIVE